MGALYGSGNGQREVVLSFDDGPDSVNTPKLLDVLAKHSVQAIFFLLGRKLAMASGKEILKRIHREGHWVGNHTYTHPDLTTLAEAEIKDEIAKTAALIGDADRGIKLFRPPYGSRNRLVDRATLDLGYQTVLWNVDTQDYKEDLMPGGWVQLGLSQIEARECSLVLAHDVHGTTVARMDEFLSAIKAIPNMQFQASKKFVKRDIDSIQFHSSGVAPSRLTPAWLMVQKLFRPFTLQPGEPTNE